MAIGVACAAMRYLATSALMIVALSACPSDDEGGDTGADTGTDPTTSPSTSNGMSTSSTTTDTSGTEEGSSSSGGGSGEAGPPVINGVTWTQAEGCMEGTGSDVEIVIDVTDPDNDVAELTFSGMIIGCTGEVDAATVTILCPQVAPYSGTIEVEDPDGNTDDIEIEIDICMDGSAMP
jgi:hypothetical protein